MPSRSHVLVLRGAPVKRSKPRQAPLQAIERILKLADEARQYPMFHVTIGEGDDESSVPDPQIAEDIEKVRAWVKTRRPRRHQ